MNRYRNIQILNDKNNKQYYRTVIYPEIPESETDIIISAKKYERLDFLSYKYYNDHTLWWIIAKANNIKGSIFIKDEIYIRIPLLIDNIISEYERLNS